MKHIFISILLVSSLFAQNYFEKGDEYYDKKNYKEAMKFHKLSAQQGHPESQFYIGFMYQGGLGVKTNPKEAIKWYRLSAKQGNPNAQYALGFCYHQGVGVKLDGVKAMKWYRLSAKQGDSYAQYALADMLRWGNDKEKEESIKWYRLSAKLGNSRAQDRLNSLCKENPSSCK